MKIINIYLKAIKKKLRDNYFALSLQKIIFNMDITQVIAARAVKDHQGLIPENQYLFSFQNNEKGQIRIVTSNDIELFYANIHEFLVAWTNICSLGWAKTKEEFEKLLKDLKNYKEDSEQNF